MSRGCSVDMRNVSIQDLVAMAESGNDKARRVAWARVIEGRELLRQKRFSTTRMMLGVYGCRTLKTTCDEAAKKLKRIDA